MLVAPVGLALLWSLAVFAPDDPPAEAVNRALDVAGATVIRCDNFSDPQATAPVLRQCGSADGNQVWR